MELGHLQLRPRRGAQLPDLVGPVLARPLPRRRPARGRGRVDALPRLRAPATANGFPTGTAAARTWRPIDFLQELNRAVYREHPDTFTVAEESTAWPQVSRPTDMGGLGFGMKWNMGWMHDTLAYMREDPVHRRYHHHQLTFSMVYAFSENFVLPLSHDEVVYGKGSLINKMPGDAWQQFANLRSLLGLHVGASGQEAALHGRRVRAAPRVDARRRARLVGRSSSPSTAACSTWWASSTASTAPNARCTSSTSRPTASSGSNANDHEQQRARLPAHARATATPVLVVSNMTPVPRQNYCVGVPQRRHLARDSSTATPRPSADRAGATWARCEAAPVRSHGQRAFAVPHAAAAVHAVPEGRRCLADVRQAWAHDRSRRRRRRTAAAAPSSMRCCRSSTAAASPSSAWPASACASTAHVLHRRPRRAARDAAVVEGRQRAPRTSCR